MKRMILPAVSVLLSAVALSAVVHAEAPAKTQQTAISDAAIESFLERKPEMVMMALQSFQNKQREAQFAQMNQTVAPVAKALLADADVPVIGNPKGTVDVVEFFDFNCGHCKNFAKNALEPVLAKNANVRVHTVLTAILGPGSVRLAQFAAAAQLQGKYPDAYTFLMKQHAGAASDADALIPALVTEAHLDKAAFEKALTDGSAQKLLDHNTELFKKAGVSGTPTIYAGGKTVPGEMDEATLTAAIRS